MKRHKKKKSIIVSIIFIIGVMIISSDSIYKIYLKLEDKYKVQNYFITSNNLNSSDNRKVDYIGILQIPKINLKKVFYDISSEKNNVNDNIEVIDGSDMPNVINGVLVIAAHSGDNSNAFFTNLDKLEYSDKIYIYYDNYEYLYKVIDIYKTDKNGKIEIENKNERLLVLTTCDELDNSKQIVYISKLISVN